MGEPWSWPLVSLMDMCPLHPTVMVSGLQPPFLLGPVQVLLHRCKSAARGIPLVRFPLPTGWSCPQHALGPTLTMTSEPWMAPLQGEQSRAQDTQAWTQEGSWPALLRECGGHWALNSFLARRI